MKHAIRNRAVRLSAIATLLATAAFNAHADVITDWNSKVGEIILEAKVGTPPAVRTMAFVQTAVFVAVNGITQRYPAGAPQAGTQGASVDAAVAAANRAVLVKLMPAQQAAIDTAYQAALVSIPDGAAKAAGIAAGERAAQAVFAQRAGDVVVAEAYRPHTTPGSYVPTAAAAVPQWSQRTPWVMAGSAEFRPGPPPALVSVTWARDYNEVKEVGSRNSTKRTAEQTDIARFWDFSLPSIYHGAVRSVANQPGRDVTRNARLFAVVAQAMDDALISVFDAKYQYNFWRPATAIRNGDTDGNDATQRDASWASLIDAPMHPEYPSAHSALAGAVAAVIKADVGNAPMPVLSTSSPTAKGATRRWTSVDDFAREVSESRVYAGIHYRTAIDVGAAMGKNIGEMASIRLMASPD